MDDIAKAHLRDLFKHPGWVYVEQFLEEKARVNDQLHDLDRKTLMDDNLLIQDIRERRYKYEVYRGILNSLKEKANGKRQTNDGRG